MDGLDGRLLEDLRRRAAAYLAPWGPSVDFEELSPARQKAVRKASTELFALMARAEAPTATASDHVRTPGNVTRSRQHSKGRTYEEDLAELTPEAEAQVGTSLDALTALMTLDSVKGFGPAKFRLLHRAGVSPDDALERPELLDVSGSTADALRRAIRGLTSDDIDLARQRAARQIVMAHRNKARILTYDSPHYPRNLYESNNPVPVLYARGNLRILEHRQAVACVGSRNIDETYGAALQDFVAAACHSRWVVVSGFATGADAIGHRTAFEEDGATVCVMPSGLDRPFPPENRAMWDRLLDSPHAVMLSEFPFGTSSSALTLQKRNKTIVGCSLGVLVGQSSAKGGAMNAFRFALEQRKPVATFEPLPGDDGVNPQAPTSGNAVIAQERKVPVAVFPLRPAFEEWQRWLTMLSSSI